MQVVGHKSYARRFVAVLTVTQAIAHCEQAFTKSTSDESAGEDIFDEAKALAQLGAVKIEVEKLQRMLSEKMNTKCAEVAAARRAAEDGQ